MAKKMQFIDKKSQIKKLSKEKHTSRLKKVSSKTSLSESSKQSKETCCYHWTATESLHYFFCQVINYHYLPKQKKQKNEALKYVEKFIKTKTSAQYISHNQKELDYSNSYKYLIRYYYGIFYELRFLNVEHMVKELDLFLKSIDFPQKQKEKMMRQTLFNMKEIDLIADVNFEKYSKISSLLSTESYSIQVQKQATYQPSPQEQVSKIIENLKPNIKSQSVNGQDRKQIEIDLKSQISYISIKDSFPELLQLTQLSQKSLQDIEPSSIYNYSQQYRDFSDCQYQSGQILEYKNLNRQIQFRNIQFS